MARHKNAVTKYEFAPDADTLDFMTIGKFITSVEQSANDEIETAGYYDGDGTPEDDVTGTRYVYNITGFRETDDAFQNWAVSVKHEVGDARKGILKVTRKDGKVESGSATVSNIVDFGGEATANAPFSCTISRNEKPEVTEGGTGV